MAKRLYGGNPQDSAIATLSDRLLKRPDAVRMLIVCIRARWNKRKIIRNEEVFLMPDDINAGTI